MILYRRCHLQRNLIGPDIKQIPVHIAGQDSQITFDIGPDIHDTKDEYFECEWIEITIDNGYPYRYMENEICEVVESSHFFSLISKDRKQVSAIRFENVTSMKLQLLKPLQR